MLSADRAKSRVGVTSETTNPAGAGFVVEEERVPVGQRM